VSLSEESSYKAVEYNIKGLYGLLKAERQSGAIIKVHLPLQNSPFDPSIEAAERINLLQMEATQQRFEKDR